MIKGQIPVTRDMEWGDGAPLEPDEIAALTGGDGGKDEADGAACRAMATALRAARRKK
jgi:hypothetical protein